MFDHGGGDFASGGAPEFWRFTRDVDLDVGNPTRGIERHGGGDGTQFPLGRAFVGARSDDGHRHRCGARKCRGDRGPSKSFRRHDGSPFGIFLGFREGSLADGATPVNADQGIGREVAEQHAKPNRAFEKMKRRRKRRNLCGETRRDGAPTGKLPREIRAAVAFPGNFSVSEFATWARNRPFRAGAPCS